MNCHMSINFNGNHRWNCSKQYLLAVYKIRVYSSECHINHITAYHYVCKSDKTYCSAFVVLISTGPYLQGQYLLVNNCRGKAGLARLNNQLNHRKNVNDSDIEGLEVRFHVYNLSQKKPIMIQKLKLPDNSVINNKE